MKVTQVNIPPWVKYATEAYNINTSNDIEEPFVIITSSSTINTFSNFLCQNRCEIILLNYPLLHLIYLEFAWLVAIKSMRQVDSLAKVSKYLSSRSNFINWSFKPNVWIRKKGYQMTIKHFLIFAKQKVVIIEHYWYPRCSKLFAHTISDDFHQYSSYIFYIGTFVMFPMKLLRSADIEQILEVFPCTRSFIEHFYLLEWLNYEH